MLRYWSSVLAALLLLAVTPRLTEPILAQSVTAVSGAVVNGTSGGIPGPGLQVNLQRVQPDGDATVAATQTDASGRFSFAASSLSSSLTYLASVSYAGVEYYSQPFSVTSPTDGMANITVYETTEDNAAVTFQRMSIVLTGADRNHQLLNFVESYRINNSAQTAYVGPVLQGEHRSLNFPLVDGAQSVVPLEGFGDPDAIAMPGGFSLSSPVLPGDTTIAFGYDVPFRETSELLSRTTIYPTAAAQFVLPDGIDGTSPQLSTPGSLTLGSRVFRTISGTQLAAGAVVEVRLSGLPATHADAFDWPKLPLWQQCSVVLLVVALATGLLLAWRRWLQPDDASRLAERHRRLEEIARLDADFGAGAIPADTYGRRRRQAIERIRELDLLLRRGPATDGDERTAAGLGP